MSRCLAVFTTVVALACSSPGSAAPDPARILRESADAMGRLKTVSAELKFGPGVTLNGLALSSASSRLRLPGDSDTMFKVRQGDLLVDVRVLVVSGRAYIQLPFSRLTPLPPDQTQAMPDLGRLFDRQSGLPSLLPAARNPRYVGSEKVGDADSDRVDAAYESDQVGRLLGARAPAGDIRASLWAGKQDHLLRRVILSGPLVEAGQDATVQVELHGFNQPVNITPPA